MPAEKDYRGYKKYRSKYALKKELASLNEIMKLLNSPYQFVIQGIYPEYEIWLSTKDGFIPQIVGKGCTRDCIIETQKYLLNQIFNAASNTTKK